MFSGALWIGAADGDLNTDGVLYRVDPLQQAAVSAMLHNITTPGGMAWTLDKKTFFFIDSKNSRVKQIEERKEGEERREQITKYTNKISIGECIFVSPLGQTLCWRGLLW